MAELQQDDVVAVPLELADLLGGRPGRILSTQGRRWVCSAGDPLPLRLPPALLPLLLHRGQWLRVLLALVSSGGVRQKAATKGLSCSAGPGRLHCSCLWRRLHRCRLAGTTFRLQLSCCFQAGGQRRRRSCCLPSQGTGHGRAAAALAWQRRRPLLLLLRSVGSRRHLPLPHVHAAVVASSHDVGAVPAEPAHQQAGAAAAGAALAACIRPLSLLILTLSLCYSVIAEHGIPLPSPRLLDRCLAEITPLPGTPALPRGPLLRLAARGPVPGGARGACRAIAQQALELALHVAGGAHPQPGIQAVDIGSGGPGGSRARPAQAAQAAARASRGEGEAEGALLGSRWQAQRRARRMRSLRRKRGLAWQPARPAPGGAAGGASHRVMACPLRPKRAGSTVRTRGGAAASRARQMRHVPSKEADSRASGWVGWKSTKAVGPSWPTSTDTGTPGRPLPPCSRRVAGT